MGYETWGNVAYFFRWDLSRIPTALLAWENKDASDAESLELGWKRTGGDDCNRTFDSWNGSSGFPDGVSIYVDSTEADDDAVLLVADMDVVASHQRDNPDNLFSVWWECDGPFEPSEKPYFNVQQGDSEHPYTSYSNVQLNYLPAEHGAKGFPDQNPDPGTHTTSYMLAPWTVNPDFEDTNDGEWEGVDASVSRHCDGVVWSGSCRLRIDPDPGDSSTWATQSPYVATWVKDENETEWQRLTVGDNTNMQYEGLFRCPPTYNSDDCIVDIWFKGDNQSWSDAHSRSVRIPADGDWYYWMDDNGPEGGQNDLVNLWVNTRGDHMDIDTQWLSGGV
jgi:hypothetical protein